MGRERRSYLIPHLLLTGRFRPAFDHLRRQRREHATSARGIARQVGAAFVTPRMRKVWARPRPARIAIPPWVDETRLRRVELAGPHERGTCGGGISRRSSSVGSPAEAEDIVEAVTGVTVRRPFADLVIVEFFLSLPAEQKFPDTHFKSLLRSFLRGRLPDTRLDRPRKAVFNEAVMARADHQRLRQLLVDPPHRLRGIDYDICGLAWTRETRDWRIRTREEPRGRPRVPRSLVSEPANLPRISSAGRWNR